MRDEQKVFGNLQPGSIFAGDYRVETLISSGGMGAVYRVNQLSTDTPRALKLMHPQLVADSNFRKRFAQEARVANRIKSEHVVQVIAAGIDEASGFPWIAMELLEGLPLDRYLAEHGPLSAEEADEVLAGVCHALAAAHAEGIVHRDVKLENLFLAETRRRGSAPIAKVLDFGVAKINAEAQTRATMPVGTLTWMAPEQTAVGGIITPRADVWALGLLAFRLLTGHHLFRSGEDPEATPAMVMRELLVDAIPQSVARAEMLGCARALPPGFAAWMDRCVTRDPAARFKDAGDAYEALSVVLRPGGAPVPETTSSLKLGALVAGVRAAHHADPLSTTLPKVPAVVHDTDKTLASTGAGESARGGVAAITPSAGRRAAWWGAAVVVGAGAALGWWRLRTGAPLVGDAPADPAPSATAAAPPSGGPVASASSSAPVAPADGIIRFKGPLGDSPSIGPADAPLTIVEFAEFQCPMSRGFVPELDKMVEQHKGRVRLVWKENPLAFHARALPAARVARQAFEEKGASGFWEAHHGLFELGTGRLDDANLLKLSEKLGLNRPTTREAIDGKRFEEPIDADIDEGQGLKVVETPFIFLNGRRVEGFKNEEGFEKLVEEELEKAEKLVASGVPAAKVYETFQRDALDPMPVEKRKVRIGYEAPTWGGGDAIPVGVIAFCSTTEFLCRRYFGVLEDLAAEYGTKVQFSWVQIPPKDDAIALLVAETLQETFTQLESPGFLELEKQLAEVYQRKQSISQPLLEFQARKAGVDLVRLKRALAEHTHEARIKLHAKLAEDADIRSPSLLVSTRPPLGLDIEGYYLRGAPPMRVIRRFVDTAIAEKAGKKD
jgi:serine/threonine protein kinase/protein-disulfide isomerase